VKKTRIREPLVLVISINLKELAGLMKGSRKNWWFLGNYLTFSKNEKRGYVSVQGI
jgi:hypothetical protein